MNNDYGYSDLEDNENATQDGKYLEDFSDNNR